MNSYEVYQYLDIIRGNESRNDKIYLLAEFLEDPTFKKIIKYAYDPFLTFGVKNIELSARGEENFDVYTYEVLEDLISRNLRGNRALEVLEQVSSYLNNESVELLKMILQKDLQCGINTKSINKALPNFLPEIGYMRCSLLKEVKLETFSWAVGCYSQIKLDGMFVNMTVTRLGENIQLTTRKGQEIPNDAFSLIVSDAKNRLYSGYQYHGEMLVRNNETGVLLDRKTANGFLNSVRQGGILPLNHKAEYVVWDMIHLDVLKNKEKSPKYMDRLKMLKVLVDSSNHIKLVETKLVHSPEEADAHFREVLDRGEEGTILKDPKMLWKDGTSKWQVKYKAEKDCELRIAGYEPGTGKNTATFGSLICISECGELEVKVSGITDEMRMHIHQNRGEYLYKVVTVKYNELIKNKKDKTYSLFLPRFVEIRNDKDEADTLKRIKNG